MTATKPPTPKKPKKAVKSVRALKEPGVFEIELEPDAWPKFEKLIRDAAKAGPKPSSPKKAS